MTVSSATTIIIKKPKLYQNQTNYKCDGFGWALRLQMIGMDCVDENEAWEFIAMSTHTQREQISTDKSRNWIIYAHNVMCFY